ncbi:38921_t:CDS:2 [Gigaspora margarita]|uniref:38921_t:CDS:1 n=1 Tax=Gigaspora margarita TaxID=4874 RepID=A0ABN7UST5_GIGMA|nr:38921_t:CDS:2 [Gigaspora margarita]
MGKDWTISTYNKASIEIRNLLNTKDLEKANQKGSWNRMKEKMSQWFQKLEQTVLENKITRTRKEKTITQKIQKEISDKKMEHSIKPFLGKVENKSPNKKMHILEWEETNKENLSHNSPLRSNIVLTSKILKVNENEVEDVSSWIRCKNEGGWAMTISLKHLKNLIAPEKRPFERKESKIEHVVLTENWDIT